MATSKITDPFLLSLLAAPWPPGRDYRVHVIDGVTWLHLKEGAKTIAPLPLIHETDATARAFRYGSAPCLN